MENGTLMKGFAYAAAVAGALERFPAILMRIRGLRGHEETELRKRRPLPTPIDAAAV
jgi:hypothetical protein